MKYTRYDLRKKKRKGATFTVAVFGTLIFAILIGALMIEAFPGLTSIASKNSSPIKNTKSIKYIAIQGGLYKEKEHADENKKILSNYGNPFIITEANKDVRVLLGIYLEDEATTQIKILSDKKIEISKMTFEIPQLDLCDIEITEILNGYFQIISNASDKKVRSVGTADFKKWCMALKVVDDSSKNIGILKDLKNNANNLPEMISKDKLSDIYIYIYNDLQKFIVKTAPNN